MRFLKPLWKKWLKIAHVIGNFQGQVILTIFYFVFVLPFGILGRIFSDPLRMRKQITKSNFQKWGHGKDTIDTARHQY